jgi:hypothetical protein
MIGMTPREADLAVERGGPAAAFGLALAELSMFWDTHSQGAPDMHEPRLNIRIEPGTSAQDGIATVQAVADWLGVGKHERFGVHHAQRRFGTGENSVIIECHFTPDQDLTHKLIRDAVQRREVPAEAAGRELAATGRAAA